MDRTNDYLEPTRGFDLNFSQDIAGLGGDVNYLRNELRGADLSRPLARHASPAPASRPATSKAGAMKAFASTTASSRAATRSAASTSPASARARCEYFYEHRQQIAAGRRRARRRTSRFRCINPDGTQQTNDSGQLLYTSAPARRRRETCCRRRFRAFNALGGKAYAIGSLELSFPIPYVPEELGIDGALFTEFGTVGLLDERTRIGQADDAVQRPSASTTPPASAPAPASASSGIHRSARSASTSRRSSRRRNTTGPKPSASPPTQGSSVMKLRNLALCAAVMIGLTNMVGAAVAQTKIYVINEERVRRDSKVGKEMSRRSAASATRASRSSASRSLGDQIKTEQRRAEAADAVADQGSDRHEPDAEGEGRRAQQEDQRVSAEGRHPQLQPRAAEQRAQHGLRPGAGAGRVPTSPSRSAPTSC